MSLFARLRFYPRSLLLRAQISATRRLLGGNHAWHALDRLGVPGHGTDLMRVDFRPQPAAPRWGYARPPHPELEAILAAGATRHLALLRECLAFAGECRAWPVDEDPGQPALPWRENLFQTPLDQAVLYGMLRHHRPERYLEIGSGMSTRVAWQARRAGGFAMKIISVDPAPRLEIAALCDEMHRRPLEEMVGEFLALTTPRSVVFFDGSHRALPGSDVTVFFLEILPRLPAGTLVHVHDIFLPADYPARQLNRFWSEQYMLAAWLLGGSRGIEVLLPCARIVALPEVRPELVTALGGGAAESSSFWLQKT
jgi:predicted O-methyltransferase YrrM